MHTDIQLIVRYWGKAGPSYPGVPKWHPLPYHSLDVAAVAAAWWDVDPALATGFDEMKRLATVEKFMSNTGMDRCKR